MSREIYPWPFKPSPDMYPKKLRSRLINRLLHGTENFVAFKLTFLPQRWLYGSPKNWPSIDKNKGLLFPKKGQGPSFPRWMHFCTEVGMYMGHLAFRFRPDRDEMVWYMEEEKFFGNFFEDETRRLDRLDMDEQVDAFAEEHAGWTTAELDKEFEEKWDIAEKVEVVVAPIEDRGLVFSIDLKWEERELLAMCLEQAQSEETTISEIIKRCIRYYFKGDKD